MKRTTVAQASLPGFDFAPQPLHRLFFALRPDAAAAARMEAVAQDVRRQHGLHGRPLAPDRLHLTLYFLGDFTPRPYALIERAIAAAAGLAAAPFELVFDRVASFASGSRKPCVLRPADDGGSLAGFHAALSKRLMQAGLPAASRLGFTPHVTLLYDEQLVAEQAVEPIGWTVRSFELIDSHVGASRHSSLAGWPLVG